MRYPFILFYLLLFCLIFIVMPYLMLTIIWPLVTTLFALGLLLCHRYRQNLEISDTSTQAFCNSWCLSHTALLSFSGYVLVATFITVTISAYWRLG